MRSSVLIATLVVALSVVLSIGSNFAAGNGGDGSFVLSSPAIIQGKPIAVTYSCRGDNVSPPLEWRGAPAGTKSLALIVEDSDAKGGSFIHWVVYNLSPKLGELKTGLGASADLPGGGKQGSNTLGYQGYTGPCPPAGPAHHYHFKLMALDSELDLPAGADAQAVRAAAKGHVLATTELMGTFKH